MHRSGRADHSYFSNFHLLFFVTNFFPGRLRYPFSSLFHHYSFFLSTQPSTSTTTAMSHIAPSSAGTTAPSWLPAKSYYHFIAGGCVHAFSHSLFKSALFKILSFSRLGGMCGAIITSPFDVVKTRLQSSLFQERHANLSVVTGNGNGAAVFLPRRPGGLLYNFVETGHILR